MLSMSVSHFPTCSFQEHVAIVPESVRMNHGLALELARKGRYWRLPPFVLQFFPRVVRVHSQTCADMRGVVRARGATGTQRHYPTLRKPSSS